MSFSVGENDLMSNFDDTNCKTLQPVNTSAFDKWLFKKVRLCLIFITCTSTR